MKIHYSDELKSRLTNAAQNGSAIAFDILNELKTRDDSADILRGSVNFFSTKKIRSTSNSEYHKMKVVFTCCPKDVTNENFPDRNNPQAPWFTENRTDVDPSTFVKYFKRLPEYSDEEMHYFTNAICINSKVTVRLYTKMQDIYDAYLGENYSPYAQYGDSSLHNSCMRHEDGARNAADFYYNFAGAQIIVAKDANGHILGRAIVWKNTVAKESDMTFSLLDRIYFSHDFVIKMIQRYATSIGIQWRKTTNDYNSKQKVTALNKIPELGYGPGDNMNGLELRVIVPASKWHKIGAPYMDTFTYLSLNNDGSLELCNYSDRKTIAELCSQYGSANKIKNVCPVCMGIHTDDEDCMCDNCRGKYITYTPFGNLITSKVVRYKGENYPSMLFRKGRPTANMALYLQLQKLYIE